MQQENQQQQELSKGDTLNEPDNEEELKKGHRRSKNDTEGRTYQCKLCGKSYLSYPALYTHCKQKHNTCNTSGRGRGRPKKDTGDNNSERIKYNPLDASYFLKEDRKGTTNNFEEPIRKAFSLLYNDDTNERNAEKKMKIYSCVEEHPFLGAFLIDKHEINMKLDNENEISDIVFMDYLNKMSTHCNQNYFARLVVFVTLFREYVNIVKKDNSKDKEYTSSQSAEDVPDLSNEFINDFLDPEKGDFEFKKEESIDLTQNLCHWMYENNFTCSKLSLIINEK